MGKKETNSKLRLVAMKYCESRSTAGDAFLGESKEKEIKTSFMFFLIEYSNRKILVDVGCEDMNGWPAYHYIKPINLLKSYGLLPEEITDVILTHSHFDHAGPINYYTNAEFYIQHQEYIDAGGDAKFADKKVTRFKDELLVANRFSVKRIGGHTNNSCIVDFECSGDRIVLAGDEVYNQKNLDNQIPMGNAANKENNLAFIKEYCRLGCTVYSCHTPDILPGQNGYKILVEEN